MSPISILNLLFDILWVPLNYTPVYFDIALISALSGMFFLSLFKRFSNQEKINQIKNKILGHIFEIRLYQDQPLQTLSSIGSIGRLQCTYLRYLFVPLSILILPALLITIQMNNRYGYQPLEENETLIIRVDFDKTKSGVYSPLLLHQISYKTPPGLRIDTPPLKILSDGYVYWRGTITNPSKAAEITFTVNHTKEDIVKKINCNPKQLSYIPKRSKFSLQTFLTHTAEKNIPQESVIQSITIFSKRAAYPFLFWDIDVLVLYFVLTMVFGLLGKPILNVHL